MPRHNTLRRPRRHKLSGRRAPRGGRRLTTRRHILNPSRLVFSILGPRTASRRRRRRPLRTLGTRANKLGTAKDDTKRAATSTLTSGLRTTNDLAIMVTKGAANGKGFLPTLSLYLPNDPDRTTSSSALVEPMRPNTTATRTGSRPEPASAGASAVPMTPKQALCSAETAQMRGTDRLGGVLGVGGGIVASGGGFGPGFSLLGASGPIVEACLLARLRRRPVAGKANAVAVCSRA